MKPQPMRAELQRRIDQKNLEIRDIEKRLAAARGYIEATQESLTLLLEVDSELAPAHGQPE